MKTMNRSLACLLALFFSIGVFAQAPSEVDVDVIYFKDGGVLRGEVVGMTKTTGRIQLRDGSVFVYKRSNIKMTAKEPASGHNAKEDSIKVATIAKKVMEDEVEKRKKEEEVRSLQKMIEANKKDKAKKADEEEQSSWRMYSALEVLGGVGIEKLPALNDTTPAMDNKNRILGFNYALGARTDYFAIGVSVGIQQTYRNLSPLASLMMLDTIPTTLLSLPVGLDMRVEFVPQGAISPYLSVNGSYAFSFTEGVKDQIVVSPAFGIRFGRKISSLLSVGYQLNMEGSDMTHYATLRLGVIF